jgi:Cu-Zn family superoxide dismutase
MSLIFLAALAVAGCTKKPPGVPIAPDGELHSAAETAPQPAAESPPPATPAQQITAVARLKPTKGNKAEATITFTQTDAGVRVAIDAEKLKPGEHGFHVHDKGDCSAPDAKSAGDHFNPSQAPHGAPDAEQRHTGDLGNLTADASGKAHSEFVDAHISLEGPNSVIGRAALLHANADDLKSQPAGNSGPRVACGVIEAGGGTMQ